MRPISFWSSIIGLLISIYGLIANRQAYIFMGLFFFIISVLLAFALLKIKERIKKTNLTIEGKRIDALNAANTARNPNRTLKVQDATHFLKVVNNDLILSFEYSGYCKNEENGFVFSLDSDVYCPFEKLVCYGFDLLNDPCKTHKIRPILLEPDGLTKKIKLPFINPIFQGDRFHVRLYCELPRCIEFGKDYVVASLSFKDRAGIKNFSVKLEFNKNHPKWVRLYDATSGKPRLIKDLKPKCLKADSVYYEDNYKNIEGEKHLVYFFERPANFQETS